MAKDYSRSDRVGQQILRELPDIIRHELKDPRIGMLTFTGVDVTRDYSHAKVFFTVLGSDEQKQETLNTLQHAAGFLRSALGQRIKLRTMPQLHKTHATLDEPTRHQQLSSVDRVSVHLPNTL